MLERLPLQQLHSDEVLAVRLINLVDRADVRMIERRGSEGFPLKSFAGGRIVLHLRGQELQRDMPVQLEVFGLVHHTHPAATELLQDAIVRDGLADHLACFTLLRARDFGWWPLFLSKGRRQSASTSPVPPAPIAPVISYDPSFAPAGIIA